MQPRTALETLDDRVEPGHTALVLVDIQNDFLHPDGTLARANLAGFMDMSMVPEMVGHARELLHAARQRAVLTIFVQMLGDLKYQSPAQVALQRRRSRPGSGDACADFSRDRHEASLRKMDMSFGYVVPAGDVISVWEHARVAPSPV
jgi:isochorismate hydrolase